MEHHIELLEDRVNAMQSLLDGHEPWSHRSRLEAIERDTRSRELAERTLGAYKRERDRLGVRVREWGGFALALAAIIVATVR